MTKTKEEIIKKVLKDIFKIYGDDKYRIQFNKAENMMEDLIKIAVEKTIFIVLKENSKELKK